MTENKPIIMKETDVSKCTHYADGECLIDYYLLYGYEISHYGYCKDCKDCYFKQLARKTQEYEELRDDLYIVEESLKDYTEHYNRQSEEVDKLKTENEGLKNEIEACYNQVEDFDIIATSKSNKLKQVEQKLKKIRNIVEPYRMAIKKLCKNCKKYDSCHACCYKDISCYKYTSPNAKACDEFTYLDKFIPNIISNQILQIIDEVE